MNARVFSGARRIDAIPAGDRGLAYGDGLFETMRVHRGSVPWWDVHWHRLTGGARRIGLPLPEPTQVRTEAASLFEDGADGVLKLLVTRGEGARGYGPSRTSLPTWVLMRHPLPSPARTGGLVLRWCDLRLATQPALAGLKHCNRLEQVLARAEWDDAGIDEGLLRNAEGDVVCATAANLFVVHDGRWRTPRIDRCGVAGVCRAWVLDAAGAEETRLAPGDVEGADALVLCNAVRGILPVARLGDRAWPPHPAVRALRRRLGAGHPAFIPAEDA